MLMLFVSSWSVALPQSSLEENLYRESPKQTCPLFRYQPSSLTPGTTPFLLSVNEVKLSLSPNLCRGRHMAQALPVRGQPLLATVIGPGVEAWPKPSQSEPSSFSLLFLAMLQEREIHYLSFRVFQLIRSKSGAVLTLLGKKKKKTAESWRVWEAFNKA